MKNLIDFLMEKPFFYRLVQSTLAGEGHEVIRNSLITRIPKGAKKILDQGCGTGEYSLICRGKYTGIDSNPDDIKYAQEKYQGQFIAASATRMPFKDGRFNLVFAVGLHHHLNNTEAKKAITESLRVTQKGGKVIIVDAMLPKNKLNAIGLVLRKLDRGKYVRKFADTLKLLPKGLDYRMEILSKFPFDYIVIDIIKR